MNNNSNKLATKRNYEVIKSNDLIRKSKHNYTPQQQKLLFYLISKIKTDETKFKKEQFDFTEFFEVCGIDSKSGQQYENIKFYLEELSNKSMWLKLDPNGTVESLVRWIDDVEIDDTNKTISFKLSDKLAPLLLELKRNFTKFNLVWTLRMKSKFSPRLYEFLKSYENMHEDIIVDLETLKDRIGTTYQKWYDIKRYCIEPAIKEINSQTDISVIYDIRKKGNSVNKIIFKIHTKSTAEQIVTKVKANAELNMKKLGQRAIEVMKDEHTIGYYMDFQNEE